VCESAAEPVIFRKERLRQYPHYAVLRFAYVCRKQQVGLKLVPARKLSKSRGTLRENLVRLRLNREESFVRPSRSFGPR
jgi:hypothetical protein